MFTLAIASILYYFGIFTFHSEHYFSCLFLEYILWCCFNNKVELTQLRDRYNNGEKYTGV